MTCSYCPEAGHNITTCRKQVQDAIDDDVATVADLEKVLTRTKQRLAKSKARLHALLANGQGGTEWEKVPGDAPNK